MGDVHTFPAKLPALALQVRALVAPPEAVALKVSFPGAIVGFAGVILEMVTAVGVAVQVVDAVAPPVPVTVKVNVLGAMSSEVGYEPPLIAAAVISTLPAPVDPMTPVPPEKVGTRVTEEL